ncbi:MAG: hypothetical protein EZS28_034524, partial [Streblomastix strix]
MISSIERNQLRMSKSKKQIDELRQKDIKDLSDEDKLRLQVIDEAIKQLTSSIKVKDQNQQVFDQASTQILTIDTIRDSDNKEDKSKRHYNKNKYKEVERETAQVEPEEVVKNTFLAHPNLEVLKFVIDCIWRVTTSRKRGDDFILNSDNFIKFWSLITQ